MDTGQRGFQGGPPDGFTGGAPGGLRGARGMLFLPPWVMYAFIAITTLVLVIAFWQIYKKAGFNGVMGLLMLIPGVNLAAMLYLAFVEWPVTRQLAEARNAAAVAAAVAPQPAPVAASAPEVSGE
jgi:hypothetical protein